jgi:hypothetical protein
MLYYLKLSIRMILGPWIWLRNVLFERVYKSDNVSTFNGCESLCRDGFAVFPNRLDLESIKRLRDDFSALQSKMPFEQSGQLAGRIYAHGPVSDLSKLYIEQFRPIAEAYFGSRRIRCELTMYQKSWPKDNVNDVPGGEFHEDDNKRNMKFFVYLTDVDENSGPFCYVPGTHGLRRPEKYLRWLLWEVFHDRRHLYSYRLNVEQCRRDELQMVGPAGLTFCADTTGYHRASNPLTGERQVFVVSYTRI